MSAAPIHVESSRRSSLVRSLCAWISASVLLLAVTLAIVSVASSRQRIMGELQEEARELAQRLAARLVTDLWNLDVPAIARYLNQAPLPRDVAYVRVLNEFHEVLTRFGTDGDAPITASQPVYHAGELIGYVQVGMAAHAVIALQRALIEYAVAMVLIGSAFLALVVWFTAGVLIRRPLLNLTVGLKHIADGEYESRLPASPYVEIDEINGEVNTMAQVIALRTRQLEAEVRERRRAEGDLRAMAGDLENLVESRTRALSQTNRHLADEIAQRKQAQDEILAISSYEQRRIGRDLHDSLGQELAGAAFLAGSLTRALRKTGNELGDQTEQLTTILSTAVSETRRIAHGLLPVEPAAGGLVNALRVLCSDSSHMFGVECTFRSQGDNVTSPPAVATHLYRIAQEAIHNAVRHGRATHVVVTLRENRATGMGTLSIMDDGGGMSSSALTSQGLGMRTMRYRAEAINGRLDVSPTAGGGTMVFIEYTIGEGAGADTTGQPS